VRSKIADLRKLERALAGMTQSCKGGSVPECPVIEVLSAAKAA
jgi:MerR family mercuric resistance operon transcriptional regulator